MLPRFCEKCKLQSPPGEESCVKCGAGFRPAGRGSSRPQKRPAPGAKGPPRPRGPRPADAPKGPDPQLSLYVLVGAEDEQRGPFDYAGLRSLRSEGDLTAASLVWTKGMDDWIPAAEVEALRPLLGLDARKPKPPQQRKVAIKPTPPGRPLGETPAAASSRPARVEDLSQYQDGDETLRINKGDRDKGVKAAIEAGRLALAGDEDALARKPPRRRLRPEEIKGFLCCEPFRPVPLADDRPMIVLGRSRNSDLVLPHESVSRAHAVIRVLGDEITLEDKSTYGTVVNGTRIREGKIEVGDVMQIGPYLISVRERPDRTASQMGEEVTRPLRTLGAGQTNEAMSGRLERVSLPEVLQTIEFNQKSGVLRVFDDLGVEAKLVVYEGAPMFAEKGEDLRDQEVVHYMLGLKRGQFSFQTKVEAGEMTMQGVTLTGILLDFSRQQDEGE